MPIMGSVHASRRAPFYEDQLGLLFDIARCFVDLEREFLELLHCRIGPDDVEELGVVGDKVCRIDARVT